MLTLPVCLNLLFSALPLPAQVPLIDEDFDEDPTANGWVLLGDAFWVSPDADECFDFGIGGLDGDLMSPENPCTVYADEGFVNLTPPKQRQTGGLFRTERVRFDSFRLNRSFGPDRATTRGILSRATRANNP